MSDDQYFLTVEQLNYLLLQVDTFDSVVDELAAQEDVGSQMVLIR